MSFKFFKLSYSGQLWPRPEKTLAQAEAFVKDYAAEYDLYAALILHRKVQDNFLLFKTFDGTVAVKRLGG